jgi:hypothetical protein
LYDGVHATALRVGAAPAKLLRSSWNRLGST